MHIVGIDRDGDGDEQRAVHTIDVWYSDRRRAWIVERLDADGHHVGVSHVCQSRADAMTCVTEWLRSHPGTCLVAPPEGPSVRDARRPVARRPISSRPRAGRHGWSSLAARA